MHRRTPKCIQVYESVISSLKGELSKRSIAYQTQQIINNYFHSKCDADKCRLFLYLLKCRYFIVVRKQLGIKVINKSFPSSHIVKSLLDYFSTIGKKSTSKYHNGAHHVLSHWQLQTRTQEIFIC